MFEEIITSKELKFNDLEKKVYRFVCFIGCLIIKLILESYDRKIMQSRNKEKYRHKGLRETSVNTIMGEIKYKRAMYEIHEEGINKKVYLLDEKLKIKVKNFFVEQLTNKNQNFANGRMVRNVYDDLIMCQARRIINIENITREDLLLITEEDFTI